MRLQHFQARVYHLLKTVPDNTIGWQELEQHYSNRTRYLDWSESAIVSLSFAVRPYLVQTSKSAQKDFLPCLWVLNPRSLNRKGYQYFSASENSRQLIIQALSEFPDMHFDATNFQGELSKNSDLFFSAKKVGSRADNDEMEGIPCLSVLHDLASQTRHNLQNLLKQKEFNPYYFKDKKILLTPIEFSIMWYLCKNRGTTVKTEDLFMEVWKEKYYEKDNNTIMVHIRHLREKMNDIGREPKYIKTIWGVGYKIEK